MKNKIKKLYEAMFLVDSALASTDWDGVINMIKNILERADCEIVTIKKWDERRLAYDIDGKNRGTYILCYLRVEGNRIRDIERDVQLSERIMRVLILKAEGRGEEDTNKEVLPTSAQETEQPEQKPAQQAGQEQELPAAVAADIGEPEQLEQAGIDDSKPQDAEDKQSQQAVGEGQGEAAEQA